MRKILVFSSHFDDAVLSAGHHMAGRPDAVVVTVFGGFPKNPLYVRTPYDKKCGFDNAEDAVSTRRYENSQALALLQAQNIDLDFPDNQYGEEITEDELVDKLQAIVDGHDYEYILGPLGLAHPDHIKVGNALTKIKANIPIQLWEDLPVRVMEPELVPERLKELGIKSKVLNPNTDKSKMADKIRALSCYSSQIGTGILDPYVMYVPERFYNASA